MCVCVCVVVVDVIIIIICIITIIIFTMISCTRTVCELTGQSGEGEGSIGAYFLSQM